MHGIHMSPYTRDSRVLVLKVTYLIVNLTFGGFENFFKFIRHMVYIFDLLITYMHEPIFNFVVVCIIHIINDIILEVLFS